MLPVWGADQLILSGRALTHPKPTTATLSDSGSPLAGAAGWLKRQKKPQPK